MKTKENEKIARENEKIARENEKTRLTLQEKRRNLREERNYGSDVSVAREAEHDVKGALISPGVHASHSLERSQPLPRRRKHHEISGTVRSHGLTGT